jgi:RNA-binding protein
MLSSKIKRSIKKNVGAEKPTVWVGKDGSTGEIMSEIDRQLEQRGAVKAKILNTALKNAEAKEIATRIANQTGATLIEIRGHTFILYRKRNKISARV